MVFLEVVVGFSTFGVVYVDLWFLRLRFRCWFSCILDTGGSVGCSFEEVHLSFLSPAEFRLLWDTLRPWFRAMQLFDIPSQSRVCKRRKHFLASRNEASRHPKQHQKSLWLSKKRTKLRKSQSITGLYKRKYSFSLCIIHQNPLMVTVTHCYPTPPTQQESSTWRPSRLAALSCFFCSSLRSSSSDIVITSREHIIGVCFNKKPAGCGCVPFSFLVWLTPNQAKGGVTGGFVGPLLWFFFLQCCWWFVVLLNETEKWYITKWTILTQTREMPYFQSLMPSKKSRKNNQNTPFNGLSDNHPRQSKNQTAPFPGSTPPRPRAPDWHATPGISTSWPSSLEPGCSTAYITSRRPAGGGREGMRPGGFVGLPGSESLACYGSFKNENLWSVFVFVCVLYRSFYVF